MKRALLLAALAAGSGPVPQTFASPPSGRLAAYQEPAGLYRSAVADMEAGRWTEAIAKFEQVLKDDPTHIPTQFNLAVCLEKSGHRDRSVETYRKLLDQDSNVYEARINLAILLYQDGNVVAAGEQFEKASALRPQDPVPVLYLARLLDRRGDLTGAETAYQRAIELDPTSAEAHFLLGSLYLTMKQAGKAYEQLIKAEQFGMKKPGLFIALSETERLRENKLTSRIYLERARDLDPNNINILRNLGVLYREAGDFPKAIEAFKRVPDATTDLASAYFDNKDFADAASLFEELLKTEPGNADYWYMLGKCYSELKIYPRAISALGKTLELKSNYAEAYGTLASIFYIQEQWALAAQMLIRFIEFKPRHAFSHFVLASCYDKLGDAVNAVLHYNKFLEYDDGSNDVRTFQARQRSKTLERRLKR